MSRRLNRLIEIDHLIRLRYRQTQNKLAAELDVSVRTIRDDIKYLQNNYDAPLEWNKSEGWRYTDPTWRLPSIPVTQGELFALTLGARMLESYSGSIYQKELRETINRIADRYPKKTKIGLRELAEERVHFRVGGEIQLDPDIWALLLEANEKSKSVWMRYYSPQSQQESERIFDSYDVEIYRASNPYVYGYCHLRQEGRQFRIDRIRKLRILDQTFIRDPQWNLQKKLGTSFQYELGGKTYDVAIYFDAATAPYITERQWHSTQMIETHGDGSITLRFTASGLNDMKRWILGYGRGAIAKSPPELVQMLQRETEQMARQNEKGEFE